MTIVYYILAIVYFIVAIVLFILASEEIIIPTSENKQDTLIILGACLLWPLTLMIYLLSRLLKVKKDPQ